MMQDHNLNNKIAIVTGGTRGLGRAIALNLARLGATVAMNYRRDEASAAKTFDEIRAIAPRSILIKADLEDEAQVRAMVTRTASELGGLDILIANAAATAFKPLLETKPHNLARTFALSVNGFVAAVQEANKVMGEGGRVLMISGIDSIRNLPATECSARRKPHSRAWCVTSPSSSARAASRSTASTSATSTPTRRASTPTTWATTTRISSADAPSAVP